MTNVTKRLAPTSGLLFTGIATMVVAGVAAGLALSVFASNVTAQTDGSSSYDKMLLPPNAQPGECYARVWVPPSYKDESTSVITQDEVVNYEVVPAKYETVSEKVMVKEASVTYENVPAEYTWIEEKVMVKPVAKQFTVVPAKFETVVEKVLDTPEHTVWKTGSGPIERVDQGTGEIMCLVTIPAKYNEVKKRVLKAPSQVKEVDVPAEYVTVKKRKIKTPATTKKTEVPAEFKTFKVQKQLSPASVKESREAAKKSDLVRRIKTTEGKMDWHPILCETNASRDVVSRIQEALYNQGYDPGPIDGVMGQGTRAAVRSFQKKKGLAVGGLTMETIRALGVRA